MIDSIVEVCFISAVVIPLLIAIIGTIMEKTIAELDAIPLSSLLAVSLAGITGVVGILVGEPGTTNVVLTSAGILFVVLIFGLLGMPRFNRLATSEPEALKQGDLDETERSGEKIQIETESGEKVQTICTPKVFLDTGKPTFWSYINSDSIVNAVLPTTVYPFYSMSISFNVSNTGLSVTAKSSCVIRPWYSVFSFNMLGIRRRNANSSSAGIVNCRKVNNRCVIAAVGGKDTETDVECSTAAVVNVLPDPDPSIVLLIASGASAFVGQKTTDGITINGEVTQNSGSSTSVTTPAPGGGGAVAGTSSNLSGKVTVYVTINMPTTSEKEKVLERPVKYKCEEIPDAT